MHTILKALVWVFGCTAFSYTSWGATDPLLWLPRCLLRSKITTLQGSVLYLFNSKCPRLSRHPELVSFSCLHISWVACHPVSLGPCIGVAGTTIFWCQLHMWDTSQLWWTHQSIQHPYVWSHIYVWHTYYQLMLCIKYSNIVVLTQDPSFQLLYWPYTCMEEKNKKHGKTLVLSKMIFCHYS